VAEDLSVNVSEDIKADSVFGKSGWRSVFINPMSDPKIAGVAIVKNQGSLCKIAPFAEQAARETGKPAVIMFKP